MATETLPPLEIFASVIVRDDGAFAVEWPSMDAFGDVQIARTGSWLKVGEARHAARDIEAHEADKRAKWGR
jgi:hypothetical protein